MSITNFEFLDYEFPRTKDGHFIITLGNAGILCSRRERLGFTMHHVAEICGLQFSQYQKLESGERTLSGYSMKTGLAMCAVSFYVYNKTPASGLPQAGALAIGSDSEAILLLLHFFHGARINL